MPLPPLTALQKLKFPINAVKLAFHNIDAKLHPGVHNPVISIREVVGVAYRDRRNAEVAQGRAHRSDNAPSYHGLMYGPAGLITGQPVAVQLDIARTIPFAIVNALFTACPSTSIYVVMRRSDHQEIKKIEMLAHNSVAELWHR